MKIYRNEVKKGIFLYDGEAEVECIIFETNIRYGSGDYEDEEIYREDQIGVFFEVEFNFLGKKSGGGNFDSIEIAIQQVEEECNQFRWID